MTTRPTRAINSSSLAAKRGLPRRSGDTNNTSSSSRSSAANTGSHSSMLVLLTVAARRPARCAAATWSRINASSGDTTNVGPAPLDRSAEVAAQYTADFPQPVACTTSTRAAGCTMAATAAT